MTGHTEGARERKSKGFGSPCPPPQLHRERPAHPMPPDRLGRLGMPAFAIAGSVLVPPPSHRCTRRSFAHAPSCHSRATPHFPRATSGLSDVALECSSICRAPVNVECLISNPAHVVQTSNSYLADGRATSSLRRPTTALVTLVNCACHCVGTAAMGRGTRGVTRTTSGPSLCF